MKFEHFLGCDECSSSDEIKDILTKQNDSGYNEFWISAEKQFPLMAMLTRNDIASVHFFPEDGHPGFCGLSSGEKAFLPEEGTTVFRTNNNSEDIWVENCCVIPLEKAIKVIEEFFETDTMPEQIEWDEL